MKCTCAPGRASAQAQRPSGDRARLSARAPGPAPACACAESRGGGRVARAPGSGRLRAPRAAGPPSAMPGMVLFGRRWAIASDDLVFPGVFELLVRVLWWVGILMLYLMHRGKLDCPGGVLLSSYLIVLLVLLAIIIGTVSAIVCVSMKGTICNPGPRKSMSKLLYVRLALFLPEMVWASLGAAWIADGVQCDRTVGSGIIATVVVSWLIIVSTVLTILIVFDPLGGKAAPGAPLGPQPLDSRESSQLLSGLRTAATGVWETRVRLLCCCIGRDDHTRVAFSRHGPGAQRHRGRPRPPPSAAGPRTEPPGAHRGSHPLPRALPAADAGPPTTTWLEAISSTATSAPSCRRRGCSTETSSTSASTTRCTSSPSWWPWTIGRSRWWWPSEGPCLCRISSRTCLRRASPSTLSVRRRTAGHTSKSLYEYSKTFIVSLVLGKDVIPRLSVTNLEDLKRRILRVIAHCNKPKYKILLRGCWYELFGGSPEDLPTELDGGDLTQPLLGEHSLLVHGSPAYSFSSESPLESPTKYPPLYPPGRIIHLEEEGASGSCSCSPAARYTVRWAHESEFSRILIGPKMLTDHMPDILMRVLDHVVSDRAACVSCPAQGGSSVDQA
ncbi:diacylglycerol lipase-beta isoform X3 [Bubalus bubalis]|uniref:diacylglycerol lipase-beta isoform X3 n=1 Tax=Bubalus bubalis TaxID=89462 RepID=UPI001E1B88C2|nr:diacylglycerol lipase-beta isoform X3 [Bubalus bubalis]